MSDLISKSEVENIAKGFNFTFKDDKKRYMDFLDYCLNNSPTIEADPVVHGKWIPHKRMAISPLVMNYMCSVCGKDNNQTKFCPECGAKMEE